MEKLDYTLADLFSMNPSNGIEIKVLTNIIKSVIPILEYLHVHYKILYVDFSCGNIAFKNDKAYMIDFGALHEMWDHPQLITKRYCSANAIANRSVYSR